jgi:pilus assembly protein Flp/PilA
MPEIRSEQAHYRQTLERGRPGMLELARFARDEDGQGLVEYALIIAVIAIAVIVAMIFLRDQITNIFSNIGNNLT